MAGSGPTRSLIAACGPQSPDIAARLLSVLLGLQAWKGTRPTDASIVGKVEAAVLQPAAICPYLRVLGWLLNLVVHSPDERSADGQWSATTL